MGQFSEALAEITKLISSINRYWSHVEPWHMDAVNQKNELTNIMYISFEAIRIAAILLQPVMPTTSSCILDTLQVPVQERMFEHAVLDKCTVTDRKVTPAKPLFPKIID
jgi:methionyl-tRNA synthetase